MFSMYRVDLFAGARAMAPWLIGSAQFGLLIGVSAAQANMPAGAGWLTGPALFGGAAQISTIHMIDAGSSTVAVITTAMVINLRLVLYSAAIAQYWRGTPLWWRLIGAYLLVDPSFVVGMQRYASEPDRRRGHAHYLGGAALLWIVWLVSIAVGAFSGAHLPAWLHLDFLVPLYLIGELAPKLANKGTRRAIIVAAVVAMACLAVPMHLGIALGLLAGFATGLLGRRTETGLVSVGDSRT